MKKVMTLGTLKPKLPKTHKCRQCGGGYIRTKIGQKVCSARCALDYIAEHPEIMVKVSKKASVAQNKVIRAARKADKERIKPLRKWLAEAQSVANKYARTRDYYDGCISCDKPFDWHGQWHGSHFRSVGSASSIRLNLWNIHKSCSVCNSVLSGNLHSYIPRLVAKIGQEKVDWLNSQNDIKRYTIEYLKRYKSVIGKRLRRMENRINENQ